MSTFNVISHGSLSLEAKQLASADAEAFDAYVIDAERKLGFYGQVYTGDVLKEVRLAIVLQVNLKVAIDTDTLTKSMVVRGSRTTAFKAGAPPDIHPMAKAIADRHAPSAARTFQSVRRLR